MYQHHNATDLSPRERAIKKLTVGLLGLLVILAICACGAASKSTGPSGPARTQNGATPTTTATPKPVQKLNVVVSSQVIKNVEGKYRYFFDVRNHDAKDFNGSVRIELYNNKQQSALGQETFDTQSAMPTNRGTSVYFDIHTGPPSVAGEYGVTHYKYAVIVGDQEVNTGSGKIEDAITQ
ncbi:hypothetical protein KDH_27450 [Dictyobacter sp. S3.2.2.5]|uniref:DUF4352 domain-containing protein n=1 Tax=Dictyobacter halimunensis TaxID=3026934 RepID=A0ABQ6FTV5_9CHLR|nr:hypothetical protein KDH_27450 [Dictyobacter sp. S3.2.2.5]